MFRKHDPRGQSNNGQTRALSFRGEGLVRNSSGEARGQKGMKQMQSLSSPVTDKSAGDVPTNRNEEESSKAKPLVARERGRDLAERRSESRQRVKITGLRVEKNPSLFWHRVAKGVGPACRNSNRAFFPSFFFFSRAAVS